MAQNLIIPMHQIKTLKEKVTMCENKKNVVVDDCLCFAINETLNHYKEKGIYPVQLQRGEVEENLNHSFGQWLSYMYTYLPRSAAESEYITMDYLSKEEVKKEFLNSKRSIKLLSCFCGNGGDVFGAITALAKMYKAANLQLPNIEVTIIEGSSVAIEQFVELFSRWERNFVNSDPLFKNCTFKLNAIEHIYDSSSAMSIDKSNNELMDYLGNEKFDLITSFKGIGEIIKSSTLLNMRDINYNKNFYTGFENHAYAVFMEIFARSLSKRGAIIIADSTYTLQGKCFTNRMLTHQAIQFIKCSQGEHDMKLLYPRPCSRMLEDETNGCDCPFSNVVRNDAFESCFPQSSFFATNSNYSYHSEKPDCMTYVMLCHKDMYEKMSPELDKIDEHTQNLDIAGYYRNGNEIKCRVDLSRYMAAEFQKLYAVDGRSDDLPF